MLELQLNSYAILGAISMELKMNVSTLLHKNKNKKAPDVSSQLYQIYSTIHFSNKIYYIIFSWYSTDIS